LQTEILEANKLTFSVPRAPLAMGHPVQQLAALQYRPPQLLLIPLTPEETQLHPRSTWPGACKRWPASGPRLLRRTRTTTCSYTSTRLTQAEMFFSPPLTQSGHLKSFLCPIPEQGVVSEGQAGPSAVGPTRARRAAGGAQRCGRARRAAAARIRPRVLFLWSLFPQLPHAAFLSAGADRAAGGAEERGLVPARAALAPAAAGGQGRGGRRAGCSRSRVG